jgi:glucose-1-phosphate thymidylyltransferase
MRAMKGLILAGGEGTRLRPITHTSAKQLVPVANEPILFHGIEHLLDAGIRTIGIVVGETAEEIRAAVGDGSRWGAEITYVHQDAPLGLAHAVKVARPFLGSDAFVMYLGDNLLEEGIGGLVADFADACTHADRPTLEHQPHRPAAMILLSHVAHPERFGVAELRDGRVISLQEKPTAPASDLALVGAYLFTPAIHEAVDHLTPSSRGELEITEAISWLIDHDHLVLHRVLTGWWLDTGKKDSLLEGNARVLETLEPRIDGEVDAASTVDGRVVIERGARITASTVRGPAIIGEDCEVHGSYIGPFTSIGPRSVVRNSEIEHSVLLDEVRVEDVARLTDSLIGRASEVVRTTTVPRATRLLVGDHCSVDLGSP